MKAFSVLQESLKTSLNDLGKMKANKKLHLTQYVYLRWGSSRLELRRNNLDLVMERVCGAKVYGEGFAIVNFNELKSVVSNASPERMDMEISEDGETLHIRCGASLYNIGIHKPQENESEYFFNLHSLGDQTPFQVMSHDLYLGFAATCDFMTTTDQRSVLQGVHFSLPLASKPSDAFKMVSANKGALALSKQTALKAFGAESFTLPKPVVDILYKLLPAKKSDTQEMKIYAPFNGSAIRIELNNTTITALALDGGYPLFESVIPSRSLTTVTGYSSDALKMVSRASNGVKRNAGETVMVIEAIPSYEPGAPSQTDFTVRNYKKGVGGTFLEKHMINTSVLGESLSIIVDPDYLVSVFKFLSKHSEMFVLEAKGGKDPLVLHDNERKFTFVLMSMVL